VVLRSTTTELNGGATPSAPPLASVPPKLASRGGSPKLEAPYKRSFWPRRLRVTREGKYFIWITFGVGFAAINTGNNLLYLLLGMLLALIVVSSVLSEMSLRELTVVRRLPRRAQVGRPHLVEIAVRNGKRRMPSYAIEIEDLRHGQAADKRCFFLKIAPDSSQVAAYRRTPARRGRERHLGFRVATRFPFGLFEKSREVVLEEVLIVYPATDPVQLPIRSEYGVEPTRGRLAGVTGDELIGVKPMREGDDPRDIYWRKSTLQAQPVVRERARESARQVTLRVDSQYAGDSPDGEYLRAFEYRIRDVASRAVAHLKRGDTVRLVSSGGQTVIAGSQVGADPVLRFLALLEPTSAGERGARA
jgi:uncharacterized protein (DUF58 family)